MTTNKPDVVGWYPPTTLFDKTPTLFVKTLSVVQSCQSHQQLSTAYKYLNMAYGAGLSYDSVLAIYGVLADKWRQFGCAAPPDPIAPPTTEYISGTRLMV